MYILSLFPYSTSLEIALAELEEIGIHNDQVLVVPLHNKKARMVTFDSIHYSDGVSHVDLASVLGTVGMILGTIYGFVLSLGPIIGGTIGLASGLFLGYSISVFLMKRKVSLFNRIQGCDVIVMVSFEESKQKKVEKILLKNHAQKIGYYYETQGCE
ncbi:hypothetical protein LC087_02770 [Bacillus carboniphilus]|uniref:DUF1269 domain-containing protein n=1 Tax=Bacillus carboniphilus TaxID=86663 RepID=A0ABY9JUR1_9BACI|nr:hypothetical protein [Bacillus carboniphilus]WLR43147.1 hypothetical protein LC087_02770 [Bacillus carboniphilus]